MKEKMNMADAKEEGSSSESEDNNTHREAEKPKVPAVIPSQDTDLGSRNNSKGFSSGSTGAKSTEDLKNYLPEDKEIESSSEDEA